MDRVGAVLLAIFNVSADTAAVAIGAGGAAILAAATAQWRLHVQLDHDTRLREREATRQAINRVVDEIDAATGPMNAASEASRELTTFRLGEIFESDERGAEDAADELGAAITNLRERRVPLMTASFRLHVRLTPTRSSARSPNGGGRSFSSLRTIKQSW